MGGPQSDMTSVLLRRDQNTHTHTQNEDHVKKTQEEGKPRRSASEEPALMTF